MKTGICGFCTMCLKEDTIFRVFIDVFDEIGKEGDVCHKLFFGLIINTVEVA